MAEDPQDQNSWGSDQPWGNRASSRRSDGLRMEAEAELLDQIVGLQHTDMGHDYGQGEELLGERDSPGSRPDMMGYTEEGGGNMMPSGDNRHGTMGKRTNGAPAGPTGGGSE